VTAPVSLDPLARRPTEEVDLVRGIAERARSVPRGDMSAALALASTLDLPLPGDGRTRLLWECLAVLGSVDLEVARAVEPHVDATAIRHEAGLSTPPGTTWGVFAAEGPGARLEARRLSGGWRLHGVKPWCSLASYLSHALVTAWIDEERRGLFCVRLDDPGVDRDPGPWAARGLAAVVSSSTTFDGAEASPVGGPGWYLSRDGFAWGGMGVAAVWYGGTLALARRLRADVDRRRPDQVALMHLGAVDVALSAARGALAGAARAVDAGRAAGPHGAVLAFRTRQAVFDAAETVLRTVDHALGPGPLVAEADHAARAADLHLYLRQHHAERDLAALGGRLLEGEAW
jgi:alkylation response protein AidB-like acyl-CoA dehydrogenase